MTAPRPGAQPRQGPKSRCSPKCQGHPGSSGPPCTGLGASWDCSQGSGHVPAIPATWTFTKARRLVLRPLLPSHPLLLQAIWPRRPPPTSLPRLQRRWAPLGAPGCSAAVPREEKRGEGRPPGPAPREDHQLVLEVATGAAQATATLSQGSVPGAQRPAQLQHTGGWANPHPGGRPGDSSDNLDSPQHPTPPHSQLAQVTTRVRTMQPLPPTRGR